MKVLHEQRYLVAARSAPRRTVLEIGHSNGHGSTALPPDAAVTAIEAAALADVAAASVDLCVVFGALEGSDDPRSLVANLRRVLRPAGIALLSTPDPGASSDGPAGLVQSLLQQQFPVCEILGAVPPAAATLEAQDGAARTGVLLYVARTEPGADVGSTPTPANSTGEVVDVEAARAVAVAEAGRAQAEQRLTRAVRLIVDVEVQVARERAAAMDALALVEEAKQAAEHAARRVLEMEHEMNALRGAEEHLASMLESASWRITRPLRILRRSTRPEIGD